ncbi:MAG: NAD+ synthase [Nitrospirae bacterium]|nr:NAD+ synthase [Nitrospirota bacterium]MBF0542400.1 NAD+ synthase [Nitrospirota bacterium]
MKRLRLTLAQINPTVGDIRGNTNKIIDYINKAMELDVDIIAFPEMCISGYPPEDLLMKSRFIDENIEALNEIRKYAGDIVVIVGFVDRKDDIYNALAVIYKNEIIDIYHKIFLPNYGVFDEMRYFQTGRVIPVYSIGGVTVGVNICEDIWFPSGPAYKQSLLGAELIININASPYAINKAQFKETMLSTRASDNSAVLAYVNTVGGQDELVFDGRSLIIDQSGEILYRGKAFKEELLTVDLKIDRLSRLHDPRRRAEIRGGHKKWDFEAKNIFIHDKSYKSRQSITYSEPKKISVEEEVFEALVLGTRDYIKKNGFSSVIIGLSGGIDSSVVAAIAVEAIGRDCVKGLFMPSKYTSKESIADVKSLAKNLGIEVFTIGINEIFEDYIYSLRYIFANKLTDTTEENLQARIRGNLMMAYSNKFGSLVLTTGNKSEMSVGYATLYGDMAGGFAVIKDVPKTFIYRLCRWLNERDGVEIIPQNVLVKEPTAELKLNQKDSDSLPPYDELDLVLEAFIEKDCSLEELVSNGMDNETVKKVIGMVNKSEYKRRQSPPGIKITRKAFGRDRRMPITNRYKD